MTKCPSCFRVLSETAFWFTCAEGNKCSPVIDQVASPFWGSEFRSRPGRILERPPGERNWRPGLVNCTVCNGPTVEGCPNCHYVLPMQWRGGRATCIAMAGARQTGKSVYIGVVMRQLEFLAAQLNTNVLPATPSTDHNFNEHYLKPLYEQRHMVQATPTSTTATSHHRDPLIFSLGAIKGQVRYLVIRDVAGEDLENARAIHEPRLSFFQFSDSVIFMFDPMRIQAIRDILFGLTPNQPQQGGNPVPVLQNLLRLLSGTGQKLGVVISKFDMLQKLREVDNPVWKPVMSNLGASYLRDPSLRSPAYDAVDGELLHHEVRSLLQYMNAGDFVNVVENPVVAPVEFRFFAVSALGAAADGEFQSDIGIAPFRCVDPIKWALANSGVLDYAGDPG